MISYIKGRIISINSNSLIVENNGIGYEVYICEGHIGSFSIGDEKTFWIYSTFSMYDGFKLYGFVSKEELEIFKMLLSSIPNTGPKKAMEYLNKIIKSIDDFKMAVLNQDGKILKNLFGFTTKTAQKILFSLKDKIGEYSNDLPATSKDYSNYETVVSALVSLGYKASQAKDAIEMVMDENRAKTLSIEEMIKLSLKKLNS